jgi:transposase InsO family protein
MAIPQGPNQRWSLDFASNALTNGRRFRILVVVDDFTSECPTLVADTSVGRLPVAHELDLQTRPLSPDRRGPVAPPPYQTSAAGTPVLPQLANQIVVSGEDIGAHRPSQAVAARPPKE